MNERIYKSTSFQFVKELIMLVIACAFLGFILHFFVQLYVNVIVVAIVGIVSLYFTLSDKKLYVKVTDETLTVVKGKKIDEYNITLYGTDSNDNTKSYDLSLLGYKQFQKLIEDLTIIGDKSEPITLKAE